MLRCAELDELGYLVAEAHFEAVRRGKLPNEPGCLKARLDPIEGEANPAFLKGIRATLHYEEMPRSSFHLEFPNAIAAGRGNEIVSCLIEEGTLKEGDAYRVRLISIPRRAAASGGFAAKPDADVRVEEAPIPVRNEPLAAWGIGSEALAAADRNRPVFIASSLLDRGVAAAIQYGKLETGALLLGTLVDDRSLADVGFSSTWAVVLTEQVEVENGSGTPTSFTFPPESLRRARQLADLRGRQESVLGTQHSHGWRCAECNLHCSIRNLFFSTEDEKMARQFPVYGAFLVIGGDPDRDPDRPVANLYVRQQGMMKAISFGTFST
jgi:hypothetical protein